MGNKAFYAAVLAIALPVMAQNGITQFVGVLDNLMVGRIGTEQMSGVAIANQLIFVFNLCIFGGLSGAGIFGAQFAGKRDNDGIRYVFRFKLIVCIIVCCLSVALLELLGCTADKSVFTRGQRGRRSGSDARKRKNIYQSYAFRPRSVCPFAMLCVKFA